MKRENGETTPSDMRRYAKVNIKDIETEVSTRSETVTHTFAIDSLLLITQIKSENAE